MKKPIETKYNSWVQLVFRIDNFIRAVGAYICYEAKKMPPSPVKNDYLGELSSDVLLFILGILVMIALPDVRKWLLAKYSDFKNVAVPHK
jgi:hypothetical protein